MIPGNTELHLATTYLDLAHGGGGRVQGLRLLLVPLLPLGGGTLLLIARLLHANHLRSKVEVIKKDHLSMYYLKNIYWARVFKKMSDERSTFESFVFSLLWLLRFEAAGLGAGRQSRCR